VPGGCRISDDRARRWWGEQYEIQPDDLVAELNGRADYARITALLRRHRKLKRWNSHDCPSAPTQRRPP
jgi:hypothetical protein